MNELAYNLYAHTHDPVRSVAATDALLAASATTVMTAAVAAAAAATTTTTTTITKIIINTSTSHYCNRCRNHGYHKQ